MLSKVQICDSMRYFNSWLSVRLLLLFFLSFSFGHSALCQTATNRTLWLLSHNGKMVNGKFVVTYSCLIFWFFFFFCWNFSFVSKYVVHFVKVFFASPWCRRRNIDTSMKIQMVFAFDVSGSLFFSFLFFLGLHVNVCHLTKQKPQSLFAVKIVFSLSFYSIYISESNKVSAIKKTNKRLAWNI